jgi:hypothetical protein
MAEPLGWRCEQVPIYSIGTMLELIYVRYHVSYVSATENARFLFLRTELHDVFVQDSNFVAVATNSGSKWECDIYTIPSTAPSTATALDPAPLGIS